jgi:hypothetical protein
MKQPSTHTPGCRMLFQWAPRAARARQTAPHSPPLGTPLAGPGPRCHKPFLVTYIRHQTNRARCTTVCGLHQEHLERLQQSMHAIACKQPQHTWMPYAVPVGPPRSTRPPDCPTQPATGYSTGRPWSPRSPHRGRTVAWVAYLQQQQQQQQQERDCQVCVRYVKLPCTPHT